MVRPLLLIATLSLAACGIFPRQVDASGKKLPFDPRSLHEEGLKPLHDNLQEDTGEKNLVYDLQDGLSPDGKLKIVGVKVGRPGFYNSYWIRNVATGRFVSLLDARQDFAGVSVRGLDQIAWHPSGKAVAVVLGWTRGSEIRICRQDKNGDFNSIESLDNSWPDLPVIHQIEGKSSQVLAEWSFGQWSKDGSRLPVSSFVTDPTLGTKFSLHAILRYDGRDIRLTDIK